MAISQILFGQYHVRDMGGFHLLDLIITELKKHMTCYKFKCSHWLKKNLRKKKSLQDLLSSLNSVISTNERNGILTDHVIFMLRYNEIYPMKTTIEEKKKITHTLSELPANWPGLSGLFG